MTGVRPALPDPTALDPGLDDADLAVRLVTEAGGLASRMRSEGLQTDFKTSVSDVVSAADRAAEDFVLAALRHARPEDGVLGEEGASHTGSSGRQWVIDPVDGTYNFLSGMHYWCSALALREGETALVGAVHQPGAGPEGETWLAAPGRPTTLNGIRLPTLEDRPLAEVSLATYLHPGAVTTPEIVEPTLAMMGGAATVRVLGSGSIDLSGVASGRIGVWTQRATADWDWFPGKAIVQGAGGRAEVVHHRGERWHVAGNAQSVSELLDILMGS